MTSQYRGSERGPSGPPGARPPGQGGPPPTRLPDDYLRGGYHDDKGNLRPEVVTKWAEEIAQVLTQGRMKKAQLRNFFVAVRQLEQRLRSGTPFDALKADVARLKPLSMASAGRNPPLAPPTFPEFIERNTALALRDEKAFKAFVKHFEAVVAYRTGMPDAQDPRR